MEDSKTLIEYGVLGVVAFLGTWWAWTLYKDNKALNKAHREEVKALHKEHREETKSLEREVRAELKQIAVQYSAKSEKLLTLVLQRHDAAMEVMRAMEDRLDVED